MIKGKKGSLYMGIIFAIFFFLFGMIMISLMKDGVTSARTDADCTNSSISDGNKLVCLGLDSSVPYYILGILTLVFGFIGRELG